MHAIMKSISPAAPRRPHNAGFALVVTLMLMVLLSILAVGLLSLSAITLRAGGRQLGQSEARANARLAIALALAQLQELTGPDTRITAPADFLEPGDPGSLANPDWRGVWKSNPSTPDSYQPARGDFFMEWLVTSGARPLDIDAARNSLPGETAVVRNSEGARDVRVPLIAVSNGGKLGWWADDESLKARANLPATPPATVGEEAVAQHAASRPVPETLEGVVDFKPTPANVAAMITPAQAGLGAGKWPDPQGIYLTPWSRSVVADVRNGGLKMDLSALFEQPEKNITGFGAWTGSNSPYDKKAYLYGPPLRAMGARWNSLYAYYNLYKDVSFRGDEPQIEPKGGLIDWHLADQKVDFGDEAGGFRYPRMAKIIYLFSWSAVKNSSKANPQPYKLELVTDFFITLWNPFDVRINFPRNATFFAKLSKSLPLKFDWHVNGVSKGETNMNDVMQSAPFILQSQFRNPENGRMFSMGPGETVVFSIKSGADNQFLPGVFFDGGIRSDTLLPGGGKITGAASDKISAGLKPDTRAGMSDDSGEDSQYLDFWIYDSTKGWPFYEHRGEIVARADAPFVRQMKAVKAEDVPEVTLESVAGRKQPFGAFIMEMKTALDSNVPIPSYLNTGAARLSSRLTNNTAEFANERLEYKMEPVTGFDSDLIQVTLPTDPAGANHGYIGSGRGPATGQTHFLYTSVPTVPPTSVAQFRHAGVGDGGSTLRATYWGFNSTPNSPFADGAIGNSYAHPLLPPAATTKGSWLDHRYLGNEALWDSYFLSSLAPRSAANFITSEGMRETWQSFLQGESKLINPRFSPWLGGETSETILRRSFPSDKDLSLTKDAYKRIAANLLLEGGFNINSTSVDAWRTFLASTRGSTINKLPKNGGNRGQKITGSGTIFSRTATILSDSVDSSANSRDADYSGFRDLSDEDIKKLAVELVKQVRLRGPFLNLAEFVNRRLTDDPELAISGPLQSAIDSSGLNDAVAAGGVTGTAKPGGITMSFPQASMLNTAAGCPGWLMQGDILDPLGPAIVPRGDTFRVRGYGDARDPQGNVTHRAWCEAVFQRVPGYLDSSEAAETINPSNPLNRRFGRRYLLTSFQWLNGPRG